MSSHPDNDVLLGQLRTDIAMSAPGRVVQSQDGTRKENPYTAGPEDKPFVKDADVDGLFGESVAYVRYKKESPTHRLILWMRLNKHKPKEIAATLGITPQTVYNVQGQPWFQEAFCKLAAELGKDAVQAFLEGEVLPAVQRTADLARSAENEGVRLAANREILDRFLGKSVAKVESKVTVDAQTTVYDAAALLKEQAKLEEQLKARGIGTN